MLEYMSDSVEKNDILLFHLEHNPITKQLIFYLIKEQKQ